ncbi:flagellar hook protein FlgE [Brenneria izadpanahii]|uniref:Flagellar hook protein FlgE n=1 Tax=Brenneria izadpanahii TaxID=2722756 RepID=A0ABX7UWH5_9GAMM|nr:flagellar hook protein FlgE [Brenneria izadpanahii]QTF07969.1 flagellar hook protein FlgE [Brenneria izadpanahii]
MGFSQAVSGLNAASSNLDVIGNNIANSETTGFKSSRTSFADVFAASDVGLGVKVAAVTQDFSDGTVESTNVGSDVAISGNGFFRLTDDSGNVYYTRNGEFSLDADSNLINTTNGYYLTGYSATNGVINAGAEPTVLSISTAGMAASATSSADVEVNLNSSLSALDAANLDTTDSTTYNYTQTLTTYDTLGNTHNIAMYFVKTADNTWSVYAQDTSDTSVTEPTNIGTLNFDSSGALTGTTELSVSTKALNGSDGNTFTIDFSGSTQQNSSNATNTKTQDGYAAGTLTEYTINNDGTISGTYSNGKTQLMGQIVLASFTNTSGLQSKGDNTWAATASSGEAILGSAGTGTFGSLTSGALESSNVDLSAELVNLIVAQRNYQSNAQTIKTQDAILNTLVNLR